MTADNPFLAALSGELAKLAGVPDKPAEPAEPETPPAAPAAPVPGQITAADLARAIAGVGSIIFGGCGAPKGGMLDLVRTPNSPRDAVRLAADMLRRGELTWAHVIVEVGEDRPLVRSVFAETVIVNPVPAKREWKTLTLPPLPEPAIFEAELASLKRARDQAVKLGDVSTATRCGEKITKLERWLPRDWR